MSREYKDDSANYLSFYNNGSNRVQVVDNYRVVLPDKKIVYISIPQQVNENTSLQVYFPSRNGANGEGVRKLANFAQFLNYNDNNGGENIVISLPKGDSNILSQKQIEYIMDYIENTTGIRINNPTQNYSGMSLGGPNSVINFKNALKNYSGRVDLTLYDPATRRQGYESRIALGSLTQEELEIMKQKNSTIRMICPLGHFKTVWSGENNNILLSAARAGVNTITIAGNFEHEESLKFSLQDGWQDFFDGRINLNEIRDTRNYYIFYPSLDENGNMVFPTVDRNGQYDYKYTLKYFQESLKNFFNSNYFENEDERYNFISAIRYLESSRVTIDFDYLSEITKIKDSTKALSNYEYKALSYGSTSLALSEEDVMLFLKSNDINDIGFDMFKDVGLIENAKDDYAKLDRQLREDSKRLF